MFANAHIDPPHARASVMEGAFQIRHFAGNPIVIVMRRRVRFVIM